MLRRFIASLFSLLILLQSGPSFGCACGCGVFDVQGTPESRAPAQNAAMLPTRPGGLAFLEYDLVNQNQTWSGGSRGANDANDDKQLSTHFVTAGAQYMFSSRWGFSGELPVWNRYFKTTAADGSIASYNHTALGDARLRAIWAGLSDDMSTGLTAGVKLPTGDYTSPGFDRDTQIGTGSTDLLLGAYHRAAVDDNWSWHARAQWDQPVLTAAQYRPGAEFNALAGAEYAFKVSAARAAPLFQLIESVRLRDSGTFAKSADTGYARLLAAPGFVVDVRGLRLSGGVGLPIAQFFNGNQLAAPAYFRFGVGWGF